MEKEAKAFRALMQLRLLRKSWVGDWKPTVPSSSSCVMWDHNENCPQIFTAGVFNLRLSFPIREMAEEFADCFKDLIKEASILL